MRKSSSKMHRSNHSVSVCALILLSGSVYVVLSVTE